MSCRVLDRILPLALTPFLAFAADAQAPTNADVTFVVPLNLTRIPATVIQVYLQCSIESYAFGYRPGSRPGVALAMVELQPSAGSVVTTAQVVVPVPLPTAQSYAGQQASYTCEVWGHTASGQDGGFTAQSTNATFKMTPTPSIMGTFVW
jgi:hypothetical protein